MDPHPIPRQITTFEFKLIGFVTLRQFIYLAVFFPLGVVFFYLVPIPLLNILLASVPVVLGLALAFVPFNERPLDVWIKNFFKKLLSSSQYYYMKKNQPPVFLEDVFIYSTPQIIQTHVDANQKLSSYLSQKNQPSTESARKQEIHQLIRSDVANIAQPPIEKNSTTQQELEVTRSQPTPTVTPVSQKKPFIFGTVKNNKNNPTPNALIYIKNKTGRNVRILKTNTHGVFASFRPLPPDDYLFEIRDLGEKYFFDTMKFTIAKEGRGPLNFVSKEIL